MKTVTFQIRSSEKYLVGFNYSNYVVKTELKKKTTTKNSGTLILPTCYSSIESYFTVDLILTILFYVYFLYPKSWTFWITDKELPIAGQE